MTMAGAKIIDTSFHFESDANGGDPDRASPTLRRYHQILWSKPLPDGTPFTLDANTPHSYLHHTSARGEFFLSSDSIVHSYRSAYRDQIGALMDQVPPEHVAQVYDEGSTIGAYILFPGDRRDRKPTINGTRGMDRKICDRIDLTLECIRRHYAGQDSPLSAALGRYRDFFELFGSFAAYVDFFLLNDLVTSDGATIRWYLPFDDFVRSPLPQTLDEYETYRQASLGFVRSRKRRIDDWATDNLA
jgi:hypothetical protein